MDKNGKILTIRLNHEEIAKLDAARNNLSQGRFLKAAMNYAIAHGTVAENLVLEAKNAEMEATLKELAKVSNTLSKLCDGLISKK